MKSSQIRSSAAALAVAFALVTSLSSGLWAPVASAQDSATRCDSKPFVVKIHAAWCATCKSLDATWAQIRSELSDQAIVVELDVSDRVAYQESRAEAERLGIADFFQEYRSQTGTIAVLDCKTREPVVILRGERDLEKYRDAVARAGRSS